MVETGLTETKEGLEEINQQSKSIQSDIDSMILQDCCDACTYNYGKEALSKNTSCIDIISQNKGSNIYGRNDETLNRCIELFKTTAKTITTCK